MSNMHDIARLESAFVRMLERMQLIGIEIKAIMDLIGNLNERLGKLEGVVEPVIEEIKDVNTGTD